MAAGMPHTEYVVIRMVDVPFIDQSGLNALMELIVDFQTRGSTVIITELQEQPRNVLARAGIAPGRLPREHVLREFPEVVPAIDERERARGAA
jgi:SulP family sulfate permease